MQDAGYTEISLRRRDGSIRAVAIVDNEDAHLARHRWFFNEGYAVRYTQDPQIGQYYLLLHREILDLGRGDKRQVDHKNRDRLDCRRSNLRIGTHALNGQNVPPRVGVSSTYRGVCWAPRERKWRAYVTLNGRQRGLGYFDDEHEAGAATAAFRAQHMPFSDEARAA
jgi:hypothetical protein